ncbi:MAG TPA: RagB/SusD family nutrient uptake outer membrane protein [Phnomibacter sp.]|nr:RagB/SusD family nutrient uptake outer membrane protein [Phnomibacter sp.]
MKIYSWILAASILLAACQKLDEYNPAGLPVEETLKTKVGLEGAINGCYTDLYFFHGKQDFLTPTEAGTDSWVNTGNSDIGLFQYNSTLNTTTGTVRVMWNGLYSLVNYCNTAIIYANDVKGYSSPDELNAKIAEAYFIRAYANWNLVEQFGDVVSQRNSAAAAGIDLSPVRSTEKAIYDSVISDLKFACKNLPVTQSLRGRVTKKAAYGLLAKVYLQRTRLGEKAEYAKLALETAEELINNPGTYKCGLYYSDATRSGYAKLFDGANNKTNTESLFFQAVDAMNGYNPEGFNRGRTRQYFLPDLGSRGAEWGTRETSILYGRSNSRWFKPSSYLLTQIFAPDANTPDTRFAETFTYKFYANADKTITAALATTYKKDPSVVNKKILGTTNAYKSAFLSIETQLEEQKNMTGDAGLAVFTPNWNIDSNIKKTMPMLVADPSDLFNSQGNYKGGTEIPTGYPNLTNMYPALKKFSSKEFAYTNQYWMGDFAIIRLGDIYLVAAEAALLYNNDQTKAAGYVNIIRKRAALTTREAEMVVPAGTVTLDFILNERGRELTGELWRWYDLKRMGKLTQAYLLSTNSIAGTNFVDSKHTKRPIPQSFLDAITNAGEFGTNGY